MVGNRSERIVALRSQMSPNEQLLKDTFIAEYLSDYDALGAGIRSGMSIAQAKRNVKSYVTDSYIRLCIAEAESRELPDNHRDNVMRQVDTVLTRLSMDPRVGSKERLAATAHRATLYGLNAPTRSQADINIRAGVMVVPGIASAVDWEATALQSQGKLVADARAPS